VVTRLCVGEIGMKRLIEMVCTGNQGRSPVAERIGRNYLAQQGALGEYDTISSGTSVDGIIGGELSIAFMIHVIGIARDRGDVYDPSALSAIEDAIGTGNDGVLRGFYNEAQQVFAEEERRYRAEVLPQFGIVGQVKHGRDQTVARSDTVGVFSMAARNNVVVERIYAESGHTPVIAVLSAYATDDPTAEIPNAFGKPRTAYEAAVETLRDHVPKAIDCLLETL
jgi:hypothetical protein